MGDLHLRRALSTAEPLEETVSLSVLLARSGEIGQVAAEGFASGVAVEGRRAVVPGDDLTFTVDADDGVLRGSPQGGERLVEQRALGGARLKPEPQPAHSGPRDEPGGESGGVGPRLSWEQGELQRPARQRNREADERAAHGAGEHRDRDPERDGQDHTVQAGRPEGQADARLKGCSECRSS